MDRDRVEGAARNVGGKIEEGVSRASGDVRGQVEGKLQQAAGTAQDLYGRARDSAGETAVAMRRQASSLEETIRETIETRPYTAVAVALAFGWFIGRMGRSY